MKKNENLFGNQFVDMNVYKFLHLWSICVNAKFLFHECVTDLNGEVLHASIGLPSTLLVSQARVGKLELKVCKSIWLVIIGS